MAGRKEGARHPAGSDGHVEIIRQLDPEAGAPGSHPVRQVSCHAPSGRGAGYGEEKRIRAVGRQGAALHQGAEVHPAVEPREPNAGRQESPADPAGCQQAAAHGLSAQGILWAAVELPIGRVCTPLFREPARRAQGATAEALRELCRYNRTSLGRYCRLLQTGEQRVARLRGRFE